MTALPHSTVPGKNAPPAWRRRLPLIGGVLLVALIIVGLWPRPVAVEIANVTRGPLVVTVDEEGMTRVKNRYLVAAPVGGQLRRIDWKAGAVVEAGKTVLAVLETRGADLLDARAEAEAQARLQAAGANREMAAAGRERARAANALARSEFERSRALLEKSTISKQEYDLAAMRATAAAQEERAAEFALQVAEFEVQQARAVLSRGRPGGEGNGEPLVITSPVSGRVLRVFQESARVVPAGFALLEIGDLTDLEVRIEVLSRDGVAIQPGARVILDQWGGPKPLEARVRLVEPSAFTKISALGVEEQRVYVLADFVDPLESRPTLGDSYRVEARIVTWEAADVLRAPTGALFQRGGLWQAYRVKNGRARLATVRLGHGNGTETEILDGLQDGDRVAVYPGDKVVDGERVAPIVVTAQ
jgi:HlyD family secretion protein